MRAARRRPLPRGHKKICEKEFAFTQDRTGDLQIFSLTLSQLSYKGTHWASLTPAATAWLIQRQSNATKK